MKISPLYVFWTPGSCITLSQFVTELLVRKWEKFFTLIIHPPALFNSIISVRGSLTKRCGFRTFHSSFTSFLPLVIFNFQSLAHVSESLMFMHHKGFFIFTGSSPRRGSQPSWRRHTPPPTAEQPPCSRPSRQGCPDPIYYNIIRKTTDIPGTLGIFGTDQWRPPSSSVCRSLWGLSQTGCKGRVTINDV